MTFLKDVTAWSTSNKGEKKVPSAQNGTLSQNVIKLKPRIGLLEAVAITVGAIIGSGIFVSPKGVLISAGSVGLSLVIWVACGFLSLTGAMCFAELGTSIPGSGGTYLYLKKAYGPIPAFLFLWVTVLISAPCGMAVLSLTFAKYVTQVFFPIGCVLPESALQLLAVSTVVFLVFVSCYHARGAIKVQNIFMVAKISALVIIILSGAVYMIKGNLQNFDQPFQNSITNPGQISLAFYSGFFSYSGWSAMNFLTEELKEPNKNLPRAIYIALPLVTVVYVTANVAYFAVMSPEEMLLSDAIAVTFGQKLFGAMSWVMSLFVAISTCGGLAISIMTNSRLIFVAARDGLCPDFLSHIKIQTLTPAPALIFLGFMSLFYLTSSDVISLINYASYTDNLANLGVISGLLYMRWRNPDLERPIKVSLMHPIIYLLTCLFTVTLPIYVKPIQVSITVVITASGLPVYYFMTRPKQPIWLSEFAGKWTRASQKLFMAVSQDD
ncbi:unnamed protein product [Allacma fusca]|uniref:Amino acid transporter n=1 Tax=Allacma fusca TaxID=39272 RepID=A0A8J2KYQ1_9HEXA|nr:unnamed protein product [Allacma fusca]